MIYAPDVIKFHEEVFNYLQKKSKDEEVDIMKGNGRDRTYQNWVDAYAYTMAYISRENHGH